MRTAILAGLLLLAYASPLAAQDASASKADIIGNNGQRIGSGAGRTVEHIDQPSEAPSARGRERRPPKQRLRPHARALRRSLAAILANSARLSRGSSRAKTSKPSFGYARRTAA